MSCKYKIKKSNNNIYFKVTGRLITDEANILAQKLDQLKKDEISDITLDISELDFIDSHGLGVLVYAWRTFPDTGIKIYSSHPHGFVKDMFEGTRLNELFDFVNKQEDL